MMKEMVKNKKGITLVSLAIAVTVIMIITGVVLYNLRSNLKIEKLKKMQNDIENLSDKVETYYMQYGDIPAVKEYEYTNYNQIQSAGVISSAVDTGKFYIIKLDLLENLTLNYGKDYEKIKNGEVTTEEQVNELTDIYIINADSHNIFYVEGISIDGEVYYTNYTKEEIDTEGVHLKYVEGVKIPDNFFYVSGSKEEGIVISDVAGDNLENEKHGNQFVWIPVDNSADEIFNKIFVRQVGYSNNTKQGDLSNAGEANNIGINSLVEETERTKEEAVRMYASVKKYGGFYIARFETGKDENNNAVVQKGATIYDYIKWSSSGEMNETEETEGGAVEVSRSFAIENKYENLTSTLCYGVQWDAALNFIDPNYITNAQQRNPQCDEDSYVRNSTGKGWYEGSNGSHLVGDDLDGGKNSVKNIYDLGGNVWEWTMESDSTCNRVVRGGHENNSGILCPASSRYTFIPSIQGNGIGFRIAIFINNESNWSPIYSKTEEYIDARGQKATIPKGFKVDVSTNIADGLVISDVSGNEFVWIPVDNSSEEVFEKKFVRQKGYENGNYEGVFDYTWEAGEMGIDSEMAETDTTKKEAAEMYASVKKHGGFYIGRYETGKDNDSKQVIKQESNPYVVIKWSASGTMQETENTTGGAVENARNFDDENNYESVKTTLCYGVQWDAALNFIDPNYITNAQQGMPNCDLDSFVRDSTGKGWYSDNYKNGNVNSITGKDFRGGLNGVKNIYDLGGNLWEWTMEAYSTGSRITRGGHFGNSGLSCPASSRYGYTPSIQETGVTYRITMYLK